MRREIPAKPVIAVAGATGAVGQEILNLLVEREFPAERVIALASSRSAGNTIPFGDTELVVEELTDDSFEGVDIAFFAAGGARSEEFRDAVVASGAVMIDNSSAFRMEEGVPLIVPEINGHLAADNPGVIANPNCSTIQMVMALHPLREVAPIKRVVVSTYQAASGAGAKAMAELEEQTREYLAGEEPTVEAFKHRLAFNAIPHIDVFLEDGSTKEEWKMVVETKKILDDPSIDVFATCVRVPVLRSHAESINVEFAQPITVEQARGALEAAPGVTVMDDPATDTYPMPGLTAGTDATYVGRLRKDPTVEHGLAFWNVADQIRKGAALNAVQIGEVLLP